MQKIYLGAIVAAAVLTGYISVTTFTAQNTGPKTLDIPTILTADAAQVDYFLKIDGIEGESRDSFHQNEIQLESWSWGETQSGTASAGGAAATQRVEFSDFNFVHNYDKASPKIMLACAKGEHIKEATLTVRKAGREEQKYLTVKFSDLIVTSVNPAGKSTDNLPMESISFNFSKIEVEYKPQNADGSLGGAVKAGWDLKANKETTTPGGT